MSQRKIALTIAGSDSGGGAGIQADLKTFGALGVYGASVVTAITAQNTLGVTAVHEVPVEIVVAQIDAVLSDIGADVVKTGMLANAPIIEAVAKRLRAFGVARLIVDPVMVATSGDRLLRSDAVDAYKHILFPMALVITPNLDEAEELVGRRLTTDGDIREAGRELHALGPRYVVMKGGHRPGADVLDLLFDGESYVEYVAPRIDTMHTHGSGCTFASAIAAGVALGLAVPEAVGLAKEYVTEAIRHAPGIGGGHGPLDHFYQVKPPGGVGMINEGG